LTAAATAVLPAGAAAVTVAYLAEEAAATAA